MSWVYLDYFDSTHQDLYNDTQCCKLVHIFSHDANLMFQVGTAIPLNRKILKFITNIFPRLSETELHIDINVKCEMRNKFSTKGKARLL